MPRDPQATAMNGLFVAKANYDLAKQQRSTTRQLLNKAILKASAVGMSKAEISRIVGSSSQRVGQIIAQLLAERLIPFVAVDVRVDRVQSGKDPKGVKAGGAWSALGWNDAKAARWAAAGFDPILPDDLPTLTRAQKDLLTVYLASPKYRAGRHVAADAAQNPDQGGTIAAQLCRLGLLRRGQDKHLDAQGHRTLVTYAVPGRKAD